MPQSVDRIVESPHPPPHFVLESIPSSLLAPVLPLYRQGSADQTAIPPCHCRIELSIDLIEEDDPTITLEARWFVDYDPAVPRLAAAVQSERLEGSFNTTDTIRALKGFNFDADRLGITSNGLHAVDVVLAETAAFDPASITLPNRAVRSGYTSAVYRFFINLKVDQDPARLRCPEVPPLSARVCQ